MGKSKHICSKISFKELVSVNKRSLFLFVLLFVCLVFVRGNKTFAFKKDCDVILKTLHSPVELPAPFLKLSDGRILIKKDNTFNKENQLTIFNPQEETFREINVSESPKLKTMNLLNDGNVFFTAEYGDSLIAKIFNPETEIFSYAGKFSVYRRFFSTVVLKDGNVLVIGGKTEDKKKPPLEKYNPLTGKVTTIVCPVNISGNSAFLLDDGRVFIDNVHNAYIYNPKTNEFVERHNYVTGCENVQLCMQKGNKLIVIYSCFDYLYACLYDLEEDKRIDIGDIKDGKEYYHSSFSVVQLNTDELFVLSYVYPLNIWKSVFSKVHAEIFDLNTMQTHPVINLPNKFADVFFSRILLDDGRVFFCNGQHDCVLLTLKKDKLTE